MLLRNETITSGVAANYVPHTPIPANTRRNITSNRSNNNRTVIEYRIFRANINDIEDDKWTEIATEVTDKSYIDETWATATRGLYRYKIYAVYSDNNISPPAFSNIIHKYMEADVTIKVNTEDSGSIDGATVSLVNKSGNTDHRYVEVIEGGIAEFSSVWLGEYIITITPKNILYPGGYTPYINEDFVINTNTLTYTANIASSNKFFYEDFEGYVFPPLGWTRIDSDGDGNNWLRAPDAQLHFFPAHTGRVAAMSASWQGTDLDPDNWLITPKISLVNALTVTLNYFVSGQDPEYYSEHYGVFISTTTNDISEFSLLFNETLPSYGWLEREVDLSIYAGMDVYIAFRHYESLPNVFLKLDTISLTFDFIMNEDEATVVPVVTQLRGNFPNPFNPSTTIEFGVKNTEAEREFVNITVYNVRGQRVKTLVNDYKSAGIHSVEWNGTDDNGRMVGSGIYFYTMRTNDYSSSRRMVLLK